METGRLEYPVYAVTRARANTVCYRGDVYINLQADDGAYFPSLFTAPL